MHRQVGRLLHRLDGEILDGLYDDGTLSADPRDHRRPIFIEMAPAGLALLAATARPASSGLFPSLFRLALAARGVIEFIRLNSPLYLAVHFIGQGGIAQPPAPVIARTGMDTQSSGNATR